MKKIQLKNLLKEDHLKTMTKETLLFDEIEDQLDELEKILNLIKEKTTDKEWEFAVKVLLNHLNIMRSAATKYDKKLGSIPLKENLNEELNRKLSVIASDIRRDWKNVNYAAKPYLDAMSELDSINDKYYQDSARSVVAYFLSNAASWKGEKAKEIKKELNAMLKKR